MYQTTVARGLLMQPEKLAKEYFKEAVKENMVVDAVFADTSLKNVIGVANLPFKVPVTQEILKKSEIVNFVMSELKTSSSLLFLCNDDETEIKAFVKTTELVKSLEIPQNISEKILSVLNSVRKWAGELNKEGEHVIDLKTPTPGPHFYVNLLLGNRVGYSHALQTTPKSVVDRLGRGSFRSHAATQVLATRWDMRQEENGFPANRQFYLVENGTQIFYSANPNDENILSATCVHSQNHTVIKYETKCGLSIKRTIFILPQMDGMPLATEVQQIEIKNLKAAERNLKLVYTGMFGTATPHALFEDVLYSNVIMQSKILTNEEGAVVAVGPDYYPEPAREDMRFHTMMIHGENGVCFPKEFCMNYNDLVGNGTLEKPEGVAKLSNNFFRKGPGFFAVAGEISLKANGTVIVDNFTGVVSSKVNKDFNENTFANEIENLVNKFKKPGEALSVLNETLKFYEKYSSFIQLHSEDEAFNTYFNKNLPFQVLYQTFVSRSFCQTQKGYREMGFREIQDIYASMYYFVSMGMADFVKQLLKEWCAQVFEFGYANHNFFWVGKEPGKWSDDALWFIQALYRYINLSGDLGFLDEEVEIAGSKPLAKRPVYETVKAILKYSAQISVGKHGMPLLDFADWNDCLKLDNDFIDGITKEKMYKEQIAKSGNENEPFKSDYSESVMNAFLLKLAIDEMIYLSGEKGDASYKEQLTKMSEKLYQDVQEHAWKGDFFARVLFNRYKNNEYTYLGAKGDNLSADPDLDGSYFLNSFNWSVLSDSATEEQIETMLNTIENNLKTPYGIKLVTLTDLGKVANDTATGHYFPGDRENGGVFKHACMMATAAMFKAAKKVKSKDLAARLSQLAYWTVDLIVPYKTMGNPFSLCGNPRFCTQYNNSDTGENIGPMLSGTSTWLNLTLLSAFGVEYTRQGIILDPIMREEEETIKYTINTGKAFYKVSIKKPKGFYRISDGNASIMVDGKKADTNVIPVFADQKEHEVSIILG